MADPAPLSLHGALAAELEAVRRELEATALRLCLDPVVFLKHADALQGFDRLAQTIAEAAGVLRSEADPDTTLAAIRLEAMRARLVLATGAY
ncbi:hypothetical protein GCM10011380_08370 [Sphingomonas metalli]|uniref:Uncharacterized protein n=1 Tax=Sphingomonas metalli TaxID=1779358 RepID=A0A916WQV9_9SPHN|nr:hypothetical protein [Sphingomonas metalli]GGB21085.1 hypothetical protein GCM10011380_08370 [Sphingomonas metalli]